MCEDCSESPVRYVAYHNKAGGKLWRRRYEFGRKEKLLSIGPYSAVGLAEACEAATNAKGLLREGRDPAVERRVRRLGVITAGRTTFEAHRPRMA